MSTAFDLTDRVALVTGATGRLGSAFCAALADAGATVVLSGRDQSELERAAEALGDRGGGGIAADLTEEGQVDQLFDRLTKRQGGVDILVNNAGVALGASLEEVTQADFERLLRVNVVGAFLCAQRAAPSMRERGGGKIVNVGSIYGTVAADQRIYERSPEMVRSSTPYAASKSALVNMTRDLAVRLAPWEIQVNLVSPGGVEADQPEDFKRRYTDRVPAGRMARPEEIAGTVVYLSAPASDYVTGQNIHVDGGLTAW
jgi:NAD(P)-dependent dehydrogenase (short-subunit alcohol dehydrogenase family)